MYCSYYSSVAADLLFNCNNGPYIPRQNKSHYFFDKIISQPFL